MTSIASRSLVLPTQLSRLVELEQVIAEMLAYLPPLANAEAVQYNVVLALHEHCVNIVKHAYGGQEGQFTVIFNVQCDPTCIQIDTYDTGPCQFNASGWQPPDLEEPPLHGLGIFLMRQLMDLVEYELTAQGNHWRLVKYLSTAADAAAVDAVEADEGPGSQEPMFQLPCEP
ncbi:MAG: hypothetical protein KatS3mg050_2244 [Litorilinea sp.]|nr:MAG: hypothetical protein KatS3mg050_2244 [Litorilinea sp.]